MKLYIVNYLLLILYMIVYMFSKKKSTKNFYFGVAVLQLILIQGLRNIYLGNDMPVYWKYYNKQLYHKFTDLSFSDFEILFKILTKIISTITSDKQIYILILSVITNMLISITVLKKSKNPILSLILFLTFGFYNFNFSGLRQAIAFAITFYSYIYIVDRKFIKFLVLVFIASLFHFSAIIFIPAYWLMNIKITNKKIPMLFILDILIYIYRVPIFRFVNTLFYEEYGIVETNSYMWMLMSLLILCLCLVFYKKVALNNNSILYNLVIVGTSSMLLSSIANNILRIANYYFMFIILLIPEVIGSIESQKIRQFINLGVILFGVALYIYLLTVDSYSIVPYTFGI